MSLEDIQLSQPPVTVSPEDYFRYYCKDPKAIEMFHQWIGNYESDYEDRIKELKEEIDNLESELSWEEGTVEELRGEVNRLEDHIEELESELCIKDLGD